MFNDKNCFFSINCDFNAKNTRWGKKTDVRGENLLQWTTDMDLNIVNLNQPTHRSQDGSTSAVDLCIVSDNLPL